MIAHYVSQVPDTQAGIWLPQEACGFDIADTSSLTRLNNLPNGVRGLLWAGNSAQLQDFTTFRDHVLRFQNNPKLFGIYVADEPRIERITPPEIRRRTDFVRTNFPGVVSYVKLTNHGPNVREPRWAPYTPDQTGADYTGIGGYSVRTHLQTQPGGWDQGLIERYVAAALHEGILLNQIIPCMQAFGGTASWPIPTRPQMRGMFDNWRRVVPNPLWDHTYSWQVQAAWGTVSLANSDMMRMEVNRHFALLENPPASALRVTVDGNPVYGSKVTVEAR
jgi:hypothetical protein